MTALFHSNTTFSFCCTGNNCVVVLRGVRLQLGDRGVMLDHQVPPGRTQGLRTRLFHLISFKCAADTCKLREVWGFKTASAVVPNLHTGLCPNPVLITALVQFGLHDECLTPHPAASRDTSPPHLQKRKIQSLFTH